VVVALLCVFLCHPLPPMGPPPPPLQHKDEFDLRWAVEAALQHKAVLPDTAVQLMQAVNDLCEEMAVTSVPGKLSLACHWPCFMAFFIAA
jgi:hypothetical protein